MYRKIQKTLLFILAILALSSCGESNIFSGSSGSNAVDGSSQWDSNAFPLKVGISSAFSGFEQQGMENVGLEWTKAHGRENFFEFDTVAPKAVGNLEDYEDSILGIYKMEQILPGYPQGSALAVTQVFADRVNFGGRSYFNIKHADIIVNYADYNFSSSGSFGTYDLQTVILHELGHFLGLGHFQEQGFASIMEPSIDTFDQIHSPYDKDQDLIRNNYPSDEASSQVSALRTIASLSNEAQIIENEEHDHRDEPEIMERNVRIVHQLNADKSCDHYVGGKKVYTHKMK